MRNLLLKYADVFSNKPGSCKLVNHHINLIRGFHPSRQHPYRIPQKLQEEVDRQLDQLLADGKIRESTSPFGHPLLCVLKKNGEVRLCTDLRYVSSGTVDDSFPCPVTEELIMKICNSNFISTLDNTSGYWQLAIAPEDCYKTAFVSHKGLFEWLVIPFGVKTANQQYSRVMNHILAPHSEYSDCYIDDTAVFSSTWLKHLKHLEAVLKAFLDVGMTLRLSKCNFGKPKVTFVGHEIGSGSRQPIPNKIESIMKIEEPKTKKLLKSFLGLCSFYRGNVPNYAALALPLTELTKNKYSNTVKFNEEQSLAFMKLKEAICNFTCLHGPRYDRPFIIRTDSSAHSVGAYLGQIDDLGIERPLAFASAKLTDAQIKYPTGQLEAYALIFALKKFEIFFFGSKIICYLDHNSLCFLAKCLPQCARLSR